MKRIKLLSIVLFTMISFYTVNAQQLGIRGGLNFSTATTDANFALESITGWQLGMTLELPVTAGLNIDASIVYIRSGYGRATQPFTSTTRVDYLDIPIDLVYKMPLGPSGIKIFIAAGPYFSYGLYSSYDDGNGNIITEFKTVDADLKKIDSGINIGAGAQFGGFRLGVYYGFGITDINKLDSESLSNRSLKIIGQYFF